MAHACIPLYRPGADLTVEATGAVEAKKFVEISGGVDVTDRKSLIQVAAPSAAGSVFGVAVTDGAIGDRIAIIRGRDTVVPVIVSAAVDAGEEVEVGDATGAVAPFSAGIKVGRAVSDAAAPGDEVFVSLY